MTCFIPLEMQLLFICNRIEDFYLKTKSELSSPSQFISVKRGTVSSNFKPWKKKKINKGTVLSYKNSNIYFLNSPPVTSISTPETIVSPLLCAGAVISHNLEKKSAATRSKQAIQLPMPHPTSILQCLPSCGSVTCCFYYQTQLASVKGHREGGLPEKANPLAWVFLYLTTESYHKKVH